MINFIFGQLATPFMFWRDRYAAPFAMHVSELVTLFVS